MPELLRPSLEAVRRFVQAAPVRRGLGGFGSGAGIGAGVGAGVGAAGGAVGSYREAKREGLTPGQAAVSALGGAASGAAKGTLLGAGVGGLGSGVAGALRSSGGPSGAFTGDTGVLGSLSRFGQRQVHALTGWTPQGYLNPEGARQLRAGAYGAKKTLDKATKATGPKAAKELQQAKEHFQAAERAERMGLTSIPGYLRSMKTHGIGETVGAGIREQWKSGPLGKAFVAAPVIGAGYELARGDPENAGKSLASMGYAMAPMPTAGSLMLAPVMSKGFGMIGRGVGKLRRKIPQVNPPTEQQYLETGGNSAPTEHMYSSRAMGEVPGGIVG